MDSVFEGGMNNVAFVLLFAEDESVIVPACSARSTEIESYAGAFVAHVFCSVAPNPSSARLAVLLALFLLGMRLVLREINGGPRFSRCSFFSPEVLWRSRLAWSRHSFFR